MTAPNNPDSQEQNRKSTPAEPQNTDRKDRPDNGFNQLDEGTRRDVAQSIGVHEDEVGSLEETGILSGRQDLAGGETDDRTETDGNPDNTHNPRGGGETGDKGNRGSLSSEA